MSLAVTVITPFAWPLVSLVTLPLGWLGSRLLPRSRWALPIAIPASLTLYGPGPLPSFCRAGLARRRRTRGIADGRMEPLIPGAVRPVDPAGGWPDIGHTHPTGHHRAVSMGEASDLRGAYPGDQRQGSLAHPAGDAAYGLQPRSPSAARSATSALPGLARTIEVPAGEPPYCSRLGDGCCWEWRLSPAPWAC
jgi:hypothetical protein